MKIPLNDILLVYESIIADINVAEVSMVLFTALDVDSLCTLKIISKFLKNENIQYKIYPVTSYVELEQKIEDCKSYQKIKLFFFINCGGLIDLTTKWFSKSAQVFLFDVNKPIHHANVESPNIRIVDDDFSELERAPTTYEVEVYQNLDQDMEELEQREHMDEDDDEIEDVLARKRKRHRSAQEALQRIQKIRKIRTQITDKVLQYYSQQFYGLPSSYIAYKMIRDLHKSNNSYLWYAIVGVTAMYLEQKIQKDQFQAISEQYQKDILKFNRDDEEKHEKDSLRKRLDFQFPLLRHWSLYESIMNSGYMIGGLALWDQQGVKKLYELISQIGLSLQQSKQLYKYMLKNSIEKLQSQLMSNAGKQKYKLLDIAYNSFVKQVDYAFEMTASDYYYVLATILERPVKKYSTAEVIEHRVECFWEAADIFTSNQEKLLKGIEEAKRVLAIYAKQARNLLERNHIMNGTAFCFVNIINDTEDRKIFQHPNSLTKLAYMLMFLIKQKKKSKSYKPFVASIQNNVTQTAQIVGILNDSKNYFSSKFNAVIEKLKVEVKMDCFMNNFMTVPKDSLVKIVRELGEM